MGEKEVPQGDVKSRVKEIEQNIQTKDTRPEKVMKRPREAMAKGVGLEEEHGDLEEVKRLEEEERRRRIEEDKALQYQHENWDQVRRLEEEERQRRIREAESERKIPRLPAPSKVQLRRAQVMKKGDTTPPLEEISSRLKKHLDGLTMEMDRISELREKGVLSMEQEHAILRNISDALDASSS